MALTKTEQLDNLYTTTWYNRLPEIIDQVFTATPFYMMLTQKGNVKSQSGGRQIEIPINYGKNSTVKGIGRGGTIGWEDTEHLSALYYDWKWIAGSCIRYMVDEQKNKGKAQIINKVNADLDNLRDSIIDKMSADLFLDGTGDAGKTIDGLAKLVAILPTTGTVGGIDRATYSWFRNKYHSMSGDDVPTTLIPHMRTMYNDCGKLSKARQRFPNIVITSQNVYEAYEDETLGIYQITSNKAVADLGFGDLAFKGMPMTWDGGCPDGYLYMLNTNFIFWIGDPSMNFSLTEWKSIPNQLDRVAQSVTQGNVVISAPATCGVIHSITP